MRHFPRSSVIIALILIATFFVGFRPLTNPVYITGHVKKNPNDTSAYIEHLLVFVKGNNKILAKAFTDSRGNFEMTFTPGKEKSFDFYCHGLGIDTFLLESISTFESDTPEMTFYIPGNPKRNSLGKVICHKCKRADKVYKIKYGDSPVVTRHINKSGDTTYSPIYKGTFYESCIAGPAKYYCDRDKVKF